MNRIKKVIIPAAGLGTRFLPATKSTPKEMFPIIDMPTLQYIVQEAADSGIEEVGIIVSTLTVLLVKLSPAVSSICILS